MCQFTIKLSENGRYILQPFCKYCIIEKINLDESC